MILLAALLMTSMVAPIAQLPDEPGLHELLYDNGGTSMRYALSLPPGYAATDGPRPLVLALHYGGHGTPYYGKAMLSGFVEPALRELDAIMVAPDCPASSWSAPEAEQAVLALVETLVESLPIDPDRVVVTGYSLGGMGTWFFASRHPERFAAAIPMAGSPRGADLDAMGETPVYAIHSTIDDVVPIGPTTEAIAELERRGADVTLVVVDDIPHFESFRFQSLLSETVEWLRELWAKP